MSPITYIERVIPEQSGRPEVDNSKHPMREVTFNAAFHPDSWTQQKADQVAQAFDALAPTWEERGHARHVSPLIDAIERGGTIPDGPALEVGSGTGIVTPHILNHFDNVISIDIAKEMLSQVKSRLAPLVRCDSFHLPIRDKSIAAAILVNALLFPHEIDRVLTQNGVIIWVNTLGSDTPIHLSAESVENAMPGNWSWMASGADWGTWVVLRRLI
ncbi:MAG: class I SAM-dependent methyltransferase [Acidimicrobiales bacterium]|nr:class I SAM-dependent methyltransferase [Acidimicrobiales bacterium]